MIQLHHSVWTNILPKESFFRLKGNHIWVVARWLAITHSVIQRLRDCFANTGSPSESRQPGRPWATTRQQEWFVVLTLLKNRTATASAFRMQSLQAGKNVHVSDQMICNRLQAGNLRSTWPAVRPCLTQAYRALDLALAQRHLVWIRRQWSRVLFTDKSSFTLSFSDGRTCVWRPTGKHFYDAMVREHNCYGSRSFMMWGGFGMHHKTHLHCVRGNLTGIGYRD